MSSDLFSVAAAARYVGVSTQALRVRRAAKEYERVEVSGKFFYERAWLDEWKAEREERAKEVLAAGAN